MPAFKLIVDSDRADLFSSLGTPLAIEAMHLTRYIFEGKELPEQVRQNVLELNKSGYTCFCIPKHDWKAIFFDMDSTVIKQESIVELAKAAGKETEVAAITERAMAGELDFKAALRARVAMLKGVPANTIEKVGRTLTINPGMHEFAAKAKEKGLKLYLVSGGFDSLAQIIAAELNFDGYLANQLEISKGSLTGQLSGTIVDATVKASFLRETCKLLGIAASSCVVIGDGANDLLMMQAGGAAIGHYPKQVLLPHINGANYHDHRALVHTIL